MCNIVLHKLVFLSDVGLGFSCAMLFVPQSTINSAQENNLQFCLDLSEPMLHKEIT